jgi:hypothetical protein
MILMKIIKIKIIKIKIIKLKIIKIKMIKHPIMTIVNRVKLIRLIYLKYSLTNEYKYSFTFALLSSYFNINIPSEAEPLIHIYSGIFLLSLIVLSCLTNVIGYLSSILFLKHYQIGVKYPKLSKILSYFEKTTIFWIIIEGIIGDICLFLILGFTLYIITNT